MHVLVDYDEWREERDRLTLVFGKKVESLGMMMRRMTANPLKWNAVLEFTREK